MWSSLLILLILQSPGDVPVLRPDDPSMGTVRWESPEVEAPALELKWGASDLRGEAFSFDAPAGSWTIELRSTSFDAYLVICTSDGEVHAEDDNGLGNANARVVVLAPESGERFEVWACSKALRVGAFELRVVEGDAPIPEEEDDSPEELALFAGQAFDQHGLGSEEALSKIRRRVLDLQAQWRHMDALLTLRPAVELLGDDPEHEHARALLQCFVMDAMGWLGRTREACDIGIECVSILMAAPEKGGSGARAYNLSYWMWQDGRYRDGLQWVERARDIALQGLPADAPEWPRLRNLLWSYQRANGQWDDFLASLDEPVVLAAGDVLEREIGLQVVNQVTDVVARDYSVRSPLDGILFQVEESGVYTLDMRSFAFDAYLVLRDDAGAVIAEDDDARGLRDARIVVSLEAGRVYLLEPTALHSGAGPYSVDLIAGTPEERTNWEQRESNLAEARACIQFADEVGGPHTLRTLDNASILFHNLGRWEDMVRVNERALEVRRQLFGAGSKDEAVGLINVAQALRLAERTGEALPLLQEVHERQLQDGGPNSETNQLLTELAAVRWSRGEIEQATELRRRLRQRLLRSYGTENLEYMDELLSEGRMLAAEERYEEAIKIGQRVVDFYASQNASESSGAAYLAAGALLELGKWQTAVFEFDAALGNLEQALQLHITTFGEISDQVAYVRMLIGWSLAYTDELDRALEEWQRAREVYEALGMSELTECLAYGADIHACRGEFEPAFDLACQSLDRFLEGQARFVSTLPEALRLRQLQSGSWYLGMLLGLAPRVAGSENEAYERLLTLKELVGRSLIQSRASARASLDPRELALVGELQNLQSELANAFHEQQPPEFLERLREQRVRVEDELTRLGGASGEVRRVSVSELARALPENAALVDLHVAAHYEPPTYVDGETRASAWGNSREVSAWIFRKGSENVVRVDLGPAAALEVHAHGLGGTLLAARGISPGEAPSAGADRDELRRRLWDPIAPHIGGAKLVFVSTSDFLGSIPLEVLQLEDDSFLIERHSFVYLSDAANLTDLGQGQPPEGGESIDGATPGPAADIGAAPQRLLLVGDVDYDAREEDVARAERLAALMPTTMRGASDSFWTALPFTAEEVELLDELFTRSRPDARSTILTGVHATERALKQALPEHTWIHVATHGFLQPEGTPSMWGNTPGVGAGVSGFFPGLLSGLVLAGANLDPATGREDGLFTAEELTWLDLSRCELVTLSACETGLGSARGGEGLIGLRRAFHQAGARTVVASLWSVEDEATARLMDSFYRYLWIEGRSRSDALRSARLDLLRANREEGDPRVSTWGAFVLSGVW